MKNIFKIFVQDIKGIKKNLIIFIVTVGITILPALYAWFNIAANWDPYSNTGELPFAVCSEDEGYTFKKITINAGDKIIDNLKENDKMGWDFVTADEAREGVTNGKYYAAVIISKDFSKNLLSVTTGDPKQAKLEYYVNNKKNAISPKITAKGIEAIQQSVDEQYVSTIAETVATALGVTGDELANNKDKLAKKITSALKTVKDNIETFSSSADLLITTLKSTDALITSSKNLIPTIKNDLVQAGALIGDIKNVLKGVKDTAGQFSESLEQIFDNGETFADTLASQLDDVFEDTEADADRIAEKLSAIEAISNKQLDKTKDIEITLGNIQFNLGVSVQNPLNHVNKGINKLNQLNKKLKEIAEKIKETGKLPSDAKSELDNIVSSIRSEFKEAGKAYKGIKSEIDSAFSKSFDSLDGVADFAETISLGDDDLNTVIKSGSELVVSLVDVFEDLKDYFEKINKKIDDTIANIKDLNADNTLESMLLPIIQDPAKLGEFISNPVATDTTELYPIENYGSAMTPFYSSLALWVGGVVLVAVLSVDLSGNDKKRLLNPKPSQMFFGRYIIFFLMGQIQAWIIALGDMFFLKAQVENPFLFIATCLISSLVYTLFIYSITITFSVIGKALAVIILVIQIAGSGGTFPVEVLPVAFKTISPFLPFRYGIDAMRECIVGADLTAFWTNIGKLMIFIIPALILGLILRKPCIRIIAFFNEKIEDSDLVI
ncbi:MAG: YhgE/Pip domain-containing protein [Eubacterium sp.]|nr:YhgE/Pip domain-containing protein [Eubacterium sp.]